MLGELAWSSRHRGDGTETVYPARDDTRPSGVSARGLQKDSPPAGSGGDDPDVACFLALATRSDGELHREALGQAAALVALNL